MDQRKDRRSRRALLTGAAAGVAAVAAKTLTPTPAQAADGDPVLLGQTNTSDNATTINTPFESALIGISSTDGGALVGINKFEQGYGVFAQSAGIGVLAVGGDTGVDARGVSLYGQVRPTVSAFGHLRSPIKGPPSEWRDVPPSAGAAGPWCRQGRRR
jgi:hypothetical protein